jgi:hypothetical protein
MSLSKKFSSKSRLSIAIVALLACTTGRAQAGAATKIHIDGVPASTTVGLEYDATFTAVDDTGATDKTYHVANLALTVTPTTSPAASVQPASVTFANGVSTTKVKVQFMTAGVQTLTIKDPAPGGVSGSVTTTAATATASALAGCTTCYAMFGVGTLVVGKYPDYNVSSNILEASHIGISTPLYAAGVAFKLPFWGDPWSYKKIKCTPDDLPTSDGWRALCYPYKAFVSLKFAPDASQTFNGFTFGLSHSLHQYLDIMVGVSYSPYSAVSPGFQQAAINVVKVQQAAGNPYYSPFSLAAMEANSSQTAFDGFPTQLLNANGTTGPLIYNGNITTSHYRPGLFLGVSLPLSLKSAFAH